jgi:hypothetical protein
MITIDRLAAFAMARAAVDGDVLMKFNTWPGVTAKYSST